MRSAGTRSITAAITAPIVIQDKTNYPGRPLPARTNSRMSKLTAFVMVVAFTAGLAGCSRDPKVRRQKYVESGDRYLQKGDLASASIQFRNAVKVDPASSEAHYRLASVDLRMQNWPEAYRE